MVFFKKKRPYIRITPPQELNVKEKNIVPAIPDDLFQKCPACEQIFHKDRLKAFKECPYCHYGYRLTAPERLALIADAESFVEDSAKLVTKNPLNFPKYAEKIAAIQEKTGLSEAVVTGVATIENLPVAIGVMDTRFMMGSMGQAVGEKLTRLFERATRERLPVLLYCASGGARMQEGMFSLMQMAKVSQAVKRHSKAGLLYMAFLTDPTTGGVTASFAMEGDLILAEPKALIGFAGPRVIQQTIQQELPADFQKAEFLLAHGFIDQIIPRSLQKARVATLLRLHGGVARGE